ncbi:signal peptidase I [Metabacillus halosaccharovorans]|uniref:signal peptidase I n=1 Tax=Metabacillus halosaccharovorans TaxID=930124 RepID=UPI0009952BAE|nr:signal peptidase I [Metabacillus halosaccharovorans]
MQFNQGTVELLIRTINKYGWMDLPSYGISMYPYIKKGNICRFVQFDEMNVKKGDVLLYHASSGQLIAHRLLAVQKTDTCQKQFILKGDTNLITDDPINKTQIIGKLATIENTKRKRYVSDLSSIMWSYIMLSFPIVSKLLRYFLSIVLINKKSSGASL